MSFFGGNDSVFVTIGETPRPIRPLMEVPECVWTHRIPEVKGLNANGQLTTFRKWMTEVCLGRNYNCYLCQTQDPFWSRLPKEDQYSRQGKAIHFGKSPTYLMPVWDYQDNMVRVLRGGKMVFEEMDKWYSLKNDVRKCDFMVSKQGSGKTTKYTTTRMNESVFDITPEIEERVKAAMEEARREYEPSSTDFLAKFITGQMQQDSADGVISLAPVGAPAGLPVVGGAIGLPPASMPHTAAATALPPAPPVATPAIGLMIPIQKDPSGHYVLTTENQWMLVSEAKEKGIAGADKL